mgnify:CR=1 FL=1|tara:strand:- start:404 stop:898 length:495 start_codon:yes stop_codon:yes gene_type:complete
MRKNKYFLILFVVGILTTLLSCNEIPNTNFQCYDLIEDMGKMYKNEKLYTGSCYTVYPENDTLIDEIRSYKKGVRHGVWAKYYQNGQLTYVGNAKKGEIDGYYKHYHKENGLLKEEGRMKNGYKDRVWKYYDLGGNLEKKELYVDQTLFDETYTNPAINSKIND